MNDVTCADFDEAAEDLSLGYASEPSRAALLSHAASCTRCGALLRDLTTTVDRLLELAPAAEPPPGFETRALAAMGVRDARERRRPRVRAFAFAVALACAVLGLIAGGLITRATQTQDAPADAVAIVTTSGRALGTAEIYSSRSTQVVVVLNAPHSWRGVWTCELQRTDGSWVRVDAWTSDDAPTGAWAAPIPSDLAKAQAMRIRSADGTIIATARFD
jgi:hypothetical protein